MLAVLDKHGDGNFWVFVRGEGDEPGMVPIALGKGAWAVALEGGEFDHLGRARLPRDTKVRDFCALARPPLAFDDGQQSFLDEREVFWSERKLLYGTVFGLNLRSGIRIANSLSDSRRDDPLAVGQPCGKQGKL
jgi:hypothetical protein